MNNDRGPRLQRGGEEPDAGPSVRPDQVANTRPKGADKTSKASKTARTSPKAEATPTAPPSAESAPRGKGRPRIGEAFTVRLPDAEAKCAIEAGERALARRAALNDPKGAGKEPTGALPEGIRIAVRLLHQLEDPLTLNEQELAYARAYGQGTVARGLEQLLREKALKVPFGRLQAATQEGKLIEAPDPFEKIFSADEAAFAKQLGDGDLVAFFRRALRVASTLGPNAFKRLDS